MRKSAVKRVWNEGGIALGTLVKSIDPVHTEALSRMNFDFLWYDLEHSDKSVETFANLARAARVGDVDVLARPARWEYMRMGRLLEAGANGILYPRCESAEEAKEVVRWAKFHPRGERGFDGGGADNTYGSYPADDYTRAANENTWIVAQIESPRALENVEGIAAVEGIDCLFFGPGDYSALTGRPGNAKGDPTIEAARRTAEAAERAGKIFSTLVFDREHAELMKGFGARALVLGADIVFFREAYSSLLADYSDFR